MKEQHHIAAALCGIVVILIALVLCSCITTPTPPGGSVTVSPIFYGTIGSQEGLGKTWTGSGVLVDYVPPAVPVAENQK